MGSFKSKCKPKTKYSINHHIIFILDYYPQYQQEFNDIYNGGHGQDFSNNLNSPNYLEKFNSYNDESFRNHLSSIGLNFPTLCQMIISASNKSQCNPNKKSCILDRCKTKCTS